MATSMPTEAPWHAAFPTPRSAQPGWITRETLLGKLKHDAGNGVAKRFLLVDLRRTDYEVRTPGLPFGHNVAFAHSYANV